MNTFGKLFRITTFGESHGKAVGVIIDGCPPNIEISEEDIQQELDRRRPGQSDVSTPRDEKDTCEILSGIFEGKTTGTSMAVIVWNKNQHSKDYENIKNIFRPSHADFGYTKKYGIRDYRGGGRSSARETIARVIGGAVAKKVLKEKFRINIWGYVSQIGENIFENIDKGFVETNSLRMADKTQFEPMLDYVKTIKEKGDSVGGCASIQVENMKVGIGSPVFGKLESLLAGAMMGIPAVKGFEIGEGFELSKKLGSEANDPFIAEKNGEDIQFKTQKNSNGGILGGISTGDNIWFKVAIKPTSSISLPQKSANMDGENVDLAVKGRHDPILVPRAIPILESMTALVILDQIMWHKAQCEL